MAQLIKLQDYISRYETDLFRYSSQFIRLKKRRWEYIKDRWNTESFIHSVKEKNRGFLIEERNTDEKPKSFLSKVFKRFRNDDTIFVHSSGVNHPYKYVGKTLDEVKENYLEEIFQFQLKWASSTIKDRSFLANSLREDQLLYRYVTSLPDNILILYRPVFVIQNAPIEVEVILISPSETWCISLLTGNKGEIYKTDKGRFWLKGYGDNVHKQVNPMLSVNRMSQIVQGIYKKSEIGLPVKKAVVCPEGFIEHTFPQPDVEFIDAPLYLNWLKKMQNISSPIKFQQLKGAQALLRHCESIYTKRIEWDEE